MIKSEKGRPSTLERCYCGVVHAAQETMYSPRPSCMLGAVARVFGNGRQQPRANCSKMCLLKLALQSALGDSHLVTGVVERISMWTRAW